MRPNLHAHIIFDCTCRDHRLVERPAKFSKEMKSKNGKPPTKLIDNYGKIIRLSKTDMSRMQDLAAIATGMERGVASDKVHLDAQRYKAQVIAEEVKALEQRDVPAIYRLLSKLEGSLSKVIIGLSALLDRIKDEVHLQKAELGRIELQKSVKSAAKTVFDRVDGRIGYLTESAKPFQGGGG